MVRVRKHLRRRPQEPLKIVDAALDILASREADHNLRKHVCHIQLSNEDSQLVPVGTFQKGKCSAANLEPRDVQDEVAAATTIMHEAEHAKDVAEGGKDATTLENEIRAHRETVKFLRTWLQDEIDKRKRSGIMRELRDEGRAIFALEKKKAEEMEKAQRKEE